MLKLGQASKFLRLFVGFAFLLNVLAPLSSQAAPRDCWRYLTEAEILEQHIDQSEADLKRLFNHYEEQVRNWRAFLAGTPFAGFHVHILHQTSIKDLNENIWNISGTEEYLETFHDLLHQFLRVNPHFGKVLHNDYKNHFIASPLDAESFDTLVLQPVIDRLVQHMEIKNPAFDWASWIPRNIYHGDGASPAEAYFHVGMSRARYLEGARQLTVEQWRGQARARRERLVQFAAAHGISWEYLLIALHKRIGKGEAQEAVLRRYLRLKGDDGTIFDELKRYSDDLQVADFHPLPDPSVIPDSLEEFFEAKKVDPLKARRSDWTVERRALFTMVQSSHYVLVTDVQGLGGIARRFQDQWIAGGARLEELQNVYGQSTRTLERFFGKVYAELQGIAGEGVKVYWSGDDAIWFLPRLSDRQGEQVGDLLRALRETGETDETITLKLYASNPVAIDVDMPMPGRVASALMRARESLFANKKKFKAGVYLK